MKFILGPILFNLYVFDLSLITKCCSLQYADDTTIYTSAKVSEINHSSNLIETDIDALKIWSRKRNLVFNADKTVTMLFSTPQVSRKHDLAKRDTYTVNCDGKAFERVKSWKILGVHIDQLITSSYAKLKQIQKMRRYSPFKIRKNMAEALILTKIDYSVVILLSIPAYQFKRLQCLQNTLAGFVLGKYAGLPDLHRLNWLPVKERMDFATVKLTHKILHNAGHYGTFNELPENIRKTAEYNQFVRLVKNYYFDKAYAQSINSS